MRSILRLGPLMTRTRLTIPAFCTAGWPRRKRTLQNCTRIGPNRLTVPASRRTASVPSLPRFRTGKPRDTFPGNALAGRIRGGGRAVRGTAGAQVGDLVAQLLDGNRAGDDLVPQDVAGGPADVERLGELVLGLDRVGRDSSI